MTQRLRQRQAWMVLISREALIAYMVQRGLSVRDLARLCGGEEWRTLIGHLRSGLRATCPPERAARIEKALNAPPGSLFVVRQTKRSVTPKVSNVKRTPHVGSAA